jgi:hypothetical protein
VGVNNKARRAAKRRKQRTAGARPAGSEQFWFDDRELDPPAPEHVIFAALTAMRGDPEVAGEQAQQLAHTGIPMSALAAAATGMLAAMTTDIVAAGWNPRDLAEITQRRLSSRQLPFLAALLANEADRHPARTVAPSWRDELISVGPADQPDLSRTNGLQLALEIGWLLQQLPAITETMPPPGRHTRTDSQTSQGPASKVLAKVRALLAKAEGTDFPEEAEALSAKAQELIARHAIDAVEADLDDADTHQPITFRRLWIDPPYILPKGMLAHAVAEANHCKSVLSEQLGFVSLIGQARDVDGSELLITSLLVQADRAMLRHGRSEDRYGRSRTTSFRRSFLISYASRIGERLQQAADSTVAASTRRTEVVPVLARVDERVGKATDRLFPAMTSRGTSVSNGAGWAAGRAAADLAHFDVHQAVPDRAAS